MPKQSAQESLRSDSPCSIPGRINEADRRLRRSLGQRSIAQTLLRPVGVVELRVGLGDVIQMTEAEAQEMIQALPLQCSNPCFSALNFQPGLNVTHRAGGGPRRRAPKYCTREMFEAPALPPSQSTTKTPPTPAHSPPAARGGGPPPGRIRAE